MRRVVVTGLGCVTPLGVGVKRTWSRLLDAQCGITSLKDSQAHACDLTKQQCHIAGVVPPTEWDYVVKQNLTDDECRRTSRFMKHALLASHEALHDAQWQPDSEPKQDRTGICMGSGIGSIEVVYDTSLALHQHGAKKVSPLFVPKLLTNLAAGHISMKYSLRGPAHAVSTACATGAHSIGDAARFIMAGDADVMLAGGAEACVHPLAFTGFERSRSLTVSHTDTPSIASRPFDCNRDGFVISEGAGTLVLEDLQHALHRKAHIYAELVGYGASSDAHHLTAPPRDGHGAYRAMASALRQAHIAPKKVDYINAHATSTKLGDAAENRAIKRLMLGDGGANTTRVAAACAAAHELKISPAQINVSSSKGALGHLLGAAGAVEAMVSVLAIQHSVLPPTLNLDQVDAEDGFDCNYVARVKQDQAVNVVLSNSFGFGGSNASLCFRRFEG